MVITTLQENNHSYPNPNHQSITPTRDFIKKSSCLINKTSTHEYKNRPVFLNVSKKILARESIFRNIDTNNSRNNQNLFSNQISTFEKELLLKNKVKESYGYDCENKEQCKQELMKNGCGNQSLCSNANQSVLIWGSFLTEEQIKTSEIYEKLQRRIEKTKRNHQEEKNKQKEGMQRMQLQIKQQKAAIQGYKVDMWDLRNEIMEMEEILNEQIEAYEELEEELGSEGEDEYDQNEGEEGQEGYSEGGSSNRFPFFSTSRGAETTSEVNFHKQYYGSSEFESGGSYDEESNNNQGQQSQQEYSKPSCSIKNFISNRTITTTLGGVLASAKGQQLTEGEMSAVSSAKGYFSMKESTGSGSGYDELLAFDNQEKIRVEGEDSVANSSMNEGELCSTSDILEKNFKKTTQKSVLLEAESEECSYPEILV